MCFLVGFDSGRIFEDFLETEVSKLAQVPIVLAVHAPSDQCSSFRDVAALVGEVVDTTKVTFVSCEPLLICFLSCFQNQIEEPKDKTWQDVTRHETVKTCEQDTLIRHTNTTH